MKSIYELQAVSDIELPNVFYIICKKQKIARINKVSNDWKAWFYKDKFSIRNVKLSVILERCENYYRKRKDALFS